MTIRLRRGAAPVLVRVFVTFMLAPADPPAFVTAYFDVT